MANEVTTTSLNDLVHGSLIDASIIYALSEQPGLDRFCREYNYIGKSTNTVSIPTETSYWGSANDRGAGVDGEFTASEASSLSNTPVSTGAVTISAAEYGVAHALTDQVDEDSVDGIELMTLLSTRMLHALKLAMDDDYIALYANLSNSVGSTGTDLSLANMIAAQQGLRTRGVVADAIVYVLDNEQVANIETALTTTNAAAAVWALSADRLIGYAPTSDHGMGAMRQVMTFRGAPVFASGLTDTANAAADVVGACVVPSSAGNDASGATTHGKIWKRLPRFEMQRQAKLRATDLVMSARCGYGELQDGAGTAIITDAP